MTQQPHKQGSRRSDRLSLLAAAWSSLAASFLILLCLLTLMPIALAQSYNEGYAKYAKGDFKGSETTLRSAFRQTKTPGEQAKILKLLGIVQFMQNKKAAAKVSFANAQRLNPTISISPEEVLDESVITFFKAAKPAAKHAAKKAKAPKKDTSGTSNKAAASAQGSPNTSGPRFGQPINGTKLSITSNVKADIMIDGILAGKTGDMLEVDPGVITVSLQAKSYKTKHARLRITKNRENRFTINLEKPKPPAPKKAPVAVAKNDGPAAAPKSAAGKKASHKGKGGKKDDKLVLPAGGTSLFKDEEPALVDDASGRDLAREYAYETGTPIQGGDPTPPAAPAGAAVVVPGQTMPQTIAPVAPAPAATMPAPGVPAQVMPVAPSGPTTVVIQAPAPSYVPPPVYAAPPPVAAPVAPAYGGAYGAVAPPPPPPPSVMPPADYYGEPPADVSSDGRRTSKKSKTKKKPSMLIALLPFGAGQFQNGDYILGLGFGTVQAFGIYQYMMASQNASSAMKSYQQEKAKTDANEPGAYSPDQLEEYRQNAQKVVKQKNQEANLGLALFAGGYAIGVMEAIFSMPDDKPVTKKKKRRRNYGLLPVEEDIRLAANEELDSLWIDQRAEMLDPGVSFDVLWLPVAHDQGGVYGLNINYRF